MQLYNGYSDPSAIGCGSKHTPITSTKQARCTQEWEARTASSLWDSPHGLSLELRSWTSGFQSQYQRKCSRAAQAYLTGKLTSSRSFSTSTSPYGFVILRRLCHQRRIIVPKTTSKRHWKYSNEHRNFKTWVLHLACRLRGAERVLTEQGKLSALTVNYLQPCRFGLA